MAATSLDEVLAIYDGESDLGNPFLPATLQSRVDWFRAQALYASPNLAPLRPAHTI